MPRKQYSISLDQDVGDAALEECRWNRIEFSGMIERLLREWRAAGYPLEVDVSAKMKQEKETA